VCQRENYYKSSGGLGRNRTYARLRSHSLPSDSSILMAYIDGHSAARFDSGELSVVRFHFSIGASNIGQQLLDGRANRKPGVQAASHVGLLMTRQR
jgi:hypothetical protein